MMEETTIIEGPISPGAVYGDERQFIYDAVRSDYAHGVPIKIIVDRYGVPRSTLHYWVRDMPRRVDKSKRGRCKAAMVRFTDEQWAVISKQRGHKSISSYIVEQLFSRRDAQGEELAKAVDYVAEAVVDAIVADALAAYRGSGE